MREFIPGGDVGRSRERTVGVVVAVAAATAAALQRKAWYCWTEAREGRVVGQKTG